MQLVSYLRPTDVDEAIQAVAAELRDHPTDVKRRTFLFELLSFAGDRRREIEAIAGKRRQA